MHFIWCRCPTLQLAKAPTLKQSLLYTLWLLWYRGLQLFHQLFIAHRPSYLIQRFRTLINQSKELYSTALLFSLCVPWPTGVFCYCFASSTVVFWQQLYHIDQLHSLFLTVDVDNCFQDIDSGVQWCLDQLAFCYASWWFWWNFPQYS